MDSLCIFLYGLGGLRGKKNCEQTAKKMSSPGLENIRSNLKTKFNLPHIMPKTSNIIVKNTEKTDGSTRAV